jgi:hypothetical protein
MTPHGPDPDTGRAHEASLTHMPPQAPEHRDLRPSGDNAKGDQPRRTAAARAFSLGRAATLRDRRCFRPSLARPPAAMTVTPRRSPLRLSGRKAGRFVMVRQAELAAAARAAYSDRGRRCCAGARHHLPDVLRLLARTGCAGRVPDGLGGLQLAVMAGLLVAVAASPRRAVPGWPRWPGLPGACLAGQSGPRPVVSPARRGRAGG